MLEDTISCLSAYQSPDISKGLCYQEQIDWLKSIKPNHWKPSQKQMEALCRAAFQYGNFDLSPYSDKDKELVSLYNNLKNFDMTQEEFRKLVPRKSVLKTEINGIEKEVLLKFFLCNKKDFDGYWLCVTEDMTNPEPTKVLDTDFEVYYNQCELKI